MAWQIKCPDGRTRHFPYANRDDAEHDAAVLDERAPGYECEDLMTGVQDCPREGRHTVEPIAEVALGGVS